MEPVVLEVVVLVLVEEVELRRRWGSQEMTTGAETSK